MPTCEFDVKYVRHLCQVKSRLASLGTTFSAVTANESAESWTPVVAQLEAITAFLEQSETIFGNFYQRLGYRALSMIDAPGRLVPVLVVLTYIHPYAFLVESANKLGRDLPISSHCHRSRI